MRIVITGASGNVGSRTVAALLDSGRVDSILGLVRRPPVDGWAPAVSWQRCDISLAASESVLREAMAGADAVVHLAWQIQPGRDLDQLRRANVDGSRRVFEAAAAAGVPALVYASSVGAYSAGPKDDPVDESWPTEGVPSSSYSRQKSEVERILDDVEARSAMRVVRLRPGLIFQAAAASEVARYFLGPFVPRAMLQRRLLPVVPAFDRLVFQAVHTDDVGAAYAAAVLSAEARGAFNIAADPVIDAAVLAEALDARVVRVPLSAVRASAAAAYQARLIPTEPGWLDMAVALPVMATDRAREVLGWRPKHTSTAALLEILEAMRNGTGGPSPVLAATRSMASRLAEVGKAVAQGGPGRKND
ncbi:MAG TPA: NAD-dependent epimerase/dehydratase family protein [Mycobacteriales bacterium]|nr:NAD-dependent epimerase/dehydratase family protein [Mycobacteriales bacterium]